MSIAETLGQLALFADLTPSQLEAIGTRTRRTSSRQVSGSCGAASPAATST